MIKIILEDKEFGVEDQQIGAIHYEISLNGDATGYDVIDAIVRTMKVAQFHDTTIENALKAALGLPIEEPKIVAPEDVEVGVEEIEIPLGVFDF